MTESLGEPRCAWCHAVISACICKVLVEVSHDPPGTVERTWEPVKLRCCRVGCTNMRFFGETLCAQHMTLEMKLNHRIEAMNETFEPQEEFAAESPRCAWPHCPRGHALGHLYCAIHEAETKQNAVQHPAHYTQGKIEVWDFIHDQDLSFIEGNVIKYVCRHKTKNGLNDLLKARQYLEKLILLNGGTPKTEF